MRRVLGVAATIAIATMWFAWMRPSAMGGNVSYVVVQGHSMEPTYEDGDLVLVRQHDKYHHGDVIAFRAGGHYNDPTRVIHRIVGDAPDGGFRTQGDNRDRIDPWTPTNENIIGSAFLHIPMAGDVAGLLTKPQTFAALGGTAVVVGSQRRRRRRRHLAPPTDREPEVDVTKTTEPPPTPAPLLPASSRSRTRSARFTHPRWAFVGLVLSVTLAIPVLGLAWSALRAPDSTEEIRHLGAVDYGIGFDYEFTGPSSAVYPTGRVEAVRTVAGALEPSDPLYTRLLDTLDITVAFRATESGADSLTSSYGATVDVETPGGWSTTLQTIPTTPFDRSSREAIRIDLRKVAQQVASVAELTGVGGDSFTITVHPTLQVTGAAAGDLVDETVSAPMSFAVEGNLITADALETSDSQELARTVNERAAYAVGPWELRTQTARGVLSGLALVLVAGIAWFASVLFGGVGLGESDRIAARYRSQIIDVAAATAPPGPVVMVGGIDELARIAKVEQSVILHEQIGDGAHRYRVFLGAVTYEYETAPEHAGAATDDEVAAGPEESGG